MRVLTIVWFFLSVCFARSNPDILWLNRSIGTTNGTRGERMITYAGYRSPHSDSIFSEIAERRLLVLELQIEKKRKEYPGYREKEKRKLKMIK